MPRIDWRYMHNPPPAAPMTWGDKAAVATVCILVGLGSALVALWFILVHALPAIPVAAAWLIQTGGRALWGL